MISNNNNIIIIIIIIIINRNKQYGENPSRSFSPSHSHRKNHTMKTDVSGEVYDEDGNTLRPECGKTGILYRFNLGMAYDINLVGNTK